MTQEEALNILKTGVNVFLTGEPGSGKTHTVNQYVAYLQSCGVQPAVTASTGIAATHIGGFTIHSWSGIGVRSDLSPSDIDHIAQTKHVAQRVRKAKVLIIDEISMLSDRTLNMINTVCRKIRQNPKPFGGLQVVLVGDFFQLPPINRPSDSQYLLNLGIEENRFSFHSPAWTALDPTVCYLSEQHRQEDGVFLGLLSALRTGAIQDSHRDLLNTRHSKILPKDVTKLYSHNANVDEINTAKLAELPGEVKVFEMESRGPEKLLLALRRGCLSPERLSLKVGARVMFTRNDVATHRYVNGTLGAVTGFSKENGFPIVKTNKGTVIEASLEEWRIEDGNRVLARITQVPLRLAWAMTIHKSQGMSLDAAHMDLSDTFEYGQGYVALSRVRTLAGLSLAGLNQRALEVHPEILEKDIEFRAQSQRASQKMSATSEAELALMQSEFIKACGGKPGMGQGMTKKERDIESTLEATKTLLYQKLSLQEIASVRNLTVGTIMNHLEKLSAGNMIDPKNDLAHIEIDSTKLREIQTVFASVAGKDGSVLLSPARAILGENFSYEELRLGRLLLGYHRGSSELME